MYRISGCISDIFRNMFILTIFRFSDQPDPVSGKLLDGYPAKTVSGTTLTLRVI